MGLLTLHNCYVSCSWDYLESQLQSKSRLHISVFSGYHAVFLLFLLLYHKNPNCESVAITQFVVGHPSDIIQLLRKIMGQYCMDEGGRIHWRMGGGFIQHITTDMMIR